MVLRFRTDDPLETLQPVVDPAAIVDLINAVRAIHVAEAVQHYLVTIVCTHYKWVTVSE